MKANLTKFCYLLNSRIIVNSFILSPRQSCLVQVINLSNKIPSQHESEPGKLKKKKLKLLLFLIWMLSKPPQLTKYSRSEMSSPRPRYTSGHRHPQLSGHSPAQLQSDTLTVKSYVPQLSLSWNITSGGSHQRFSGLDHCDAVSPH